MPPRSRLADPAGLWRSLRWRASVLSVEGELERVRERIELRAAREDLARARAGRDVCWLEDPRDDNPLVTVRIATYNRPGLLVERAVASALRQTYDHLEVLVVGDCTDEATGHAMAAVRDTRVRYINLPHPSLYPESRRERHAVSGSVPMTVGNLLARGAWIAPCDDDDELSDDHVEVLLRKAKADRLELVHSNTSREVAPDVWETIGTHPITAGQVTTGSVLFSAGLRFLPYSLTCWKLPEPHDWNLWRRMRDIGVRIGYLDQVTYRYFLPDHDDAMRGRPGPPPA